MPAVSVLTACAPVHLPLLPQAGESLKEQGCDWQWLIHVDGPEAELPAGLERDARVQILWGGQPRGIAISRNRLLADVDCPWVVTLDADDRFVPGGLDVLLEYSAEDVGWVNGRVLLWDPDGDAQQIPNQPGVMPPGLLGPGAMEARWRSHGWHGINCQATLWHTDRLLAVGGWTALSTAEDADAMMAVNALWPCRHLEQRVLLYRQHGHQITRSQEFQQHRLRHRRFTHRRQLALRRLQGLPVPPEYRDPPEPPGTHLGR